MSYADTLLANGERINTIWEVRDLLAWLRLLVDPGDMRRDLHDPSRHGPPPGWSISGARHPKVAPC